MIAAGGVGGVDRLEVHHRFTDRQDGDLFVGLAEQELAERRERIAPLPWTWLDQVHGSRVVVVDSPGQHAGAKADAAVTAVVGATLAVHTADCAGVLLRSVGESDVMVIGAAHAGWRGLEGGVLRETVSAMRSIGARDIRWRLGPCISPVRYEFSPPELDRLAAALGDEVRGVTSEGATAFDLRAGVAAELAAVGVVPDDGYMDRTRCTAGDDRFFSWRARRDRGRQAAVTWITADGSDVAVERPSR